MQKLTAREKRFCEEYVRCRDAREAAVAAGWPETVTDRELDALLLDEDLREYRREREQALFEALNLSPAWVGLRLAEVAARCLQAVPHMRRNPETKQQEPDGVWEFDAGGALRALHEIAELFCPEGEGGSVSFEQWLAAQDEEGHL